MTIRLTMLGLAFGLTTLTGCVAGAGYETYSGPVYYDPAPVVVDEVVVAPRYRHYRGPRYYDRRYDHYRDYRDHRDYRGRRDYYRDRYRPRG